MELSYLLSLSDAFGTTLFSLFDDLDSAVSGELDPASAARFVERARTAVRSYQGLVARLDDSSVKLAYLFVRRHGEHVAELQRALAEMERNRVRRSIELP